MNILSQCQLSAAQRILVIRQVLERMSYSIIFYDTNSCDVVSSFNTLCKSEADFAFVIDYLLAHLDDTQPYNVEQVFVALTRLNYPAQFEARILKATLNRFNQENAQPTPLVVQIKDAFFTLIRKMTLPDDTIAEMTAELIMAVSTQHHPMLCIMACMSLSHLYTRSERKADIRAALLQCALTAEKQVAGIAFAALAKLPDLTMKAADIEQMVLSVRGCNYADEFRMLAHVKVTDVQPSFINTLLNLIIVNDHVTLVPDIFVDLIKRSAPHAIPMMIDLLVTILKEKYNNHACARMLTNLPLSSETALTVMNLLLPRFVSFTQFEKELFGALMGKLSYEARVAVLIALEQNEHHNLSLILFIDKIKCEYIDMPIAMKSAPVYHPEIPTLPEEIHERIFTAAYRSG